MLMSDADREILQRRLGSEEIPAEVQKVYYKAQKLHHATHGGPLPPDVLIVVCLLAGYPKDSAMKADAKEAAEKVAAKNAAQKVADQAQAKDPKAENKTQKQK